MSIDMFIKLKANGTDIAGDSVQKGFSNWIEGGRVSSFDMAGEDEAMEEIWLVFTEVTATDPNGITFTDSFSSAT